MRIERLDHLVLTVTDVRKTIDFYTRVLGMEEITFGEGRKALKFGTSKINLHQAGEEVVPHARHAAPGSADLCFITNERVDKVHARMGELGVGIVEGPVGRTGATGEIVSVYVRDPDGNLIELSNYR